MNVLIVSFNYPPFNSIAGLGVSKVSRHLIEFGWGVRVLCARHADLPEGLPIEIPADRVTRTGYFDVNAIPKLVLGRSHVRRRGFEFQQERRLLTRLGHLYRNLTNYPDGQIGWYPSAVRAGSELIRKEPPDVILSVATPWTSHLVSHALSKRFGIPWVAQYHDPWTDSRSRGRIWPVRLMERRLEDTTVSTAAMILTASEAWRAQMSARFPSIPVEVVPLGFEPSDYGRMSPPSTPPLVLAYTGRLYDRQDPAKLFHAVRDLLDAKQISEEEVSLRFVGRYLDVARRALRRADLPSNMVTLDDPVSHEEAAAIQQRAHALVLFLGEDDDVGWRPAKLYEYLGAGRPVLVIGGTAEHEALRILRSAGAATWAPSPSQIAMTISGWLGELRASGVLKVDLDPSVINSYSWPTIVSRASGLLRLAGARSLVRPERRERGERSVPPVKS